jgi:hypothetical protein
MRAPHVLGSLLLVLAQGCILQNLSTSERLRDAVVGFNDECRWARNDLAVQRVVPEFRGDFRMGHLAWGRTIQIADQEIVNVDASADEENDSAVSYVAVRWYDTNGMILADTVLRQQWTKVRGGFLLVREEVVEGDPRLIAIPERPEDEATPEAEAPEADASASTLTSGASL